MHINFVVRKREDRCVHSCRGPWVGLVMALSIVVERTACGVWSWGALSTCFVGVGDFGAGRAKISYGSITDN